MPDHRNSRAAVDTGLRYCVRTVETKLRPGKSNHVSTLTMADARPFVGHGQSSIGARGVSRGDHSCLKQVRTQGIAPLRCKAQKADRATVNLYGQRETEYAPYMAAMTGTD